MSRIGRQPIDIPDKVEVSLEGRAVTVKGPKGTLSLDVHPDMELRHEDGQLTVHRGSDTPRRRALHGMTRALVANMVTGVTDGFEKELNIVGVGYRADVQGKGVKLTVGYSHPVQYDAPEGISLECPEPTRVVVKGVDKQLVGQTAAEIRGVRPPEPYKGKGIRYGDEEVQRKAGKTAGA